MVIRISDDCLVLEKEGGERTAMGTDSFGTQYLYLDNREVFEKLKLSQKIDLENFETSYGITAPLVGDCTKYTIEYYGHQGGILENSRLE